MPRTKPRKEIHHETNTHELLLCLESAPQWVRILIKNTDKPFCPFIKWYADKYFHEERTSRITIKQLSKEYGLADSTRITKWISEAYYEIINLHLEQPSLFEGNGIKTNCRCKYFDDSTFLTLWFPVVPRMYEEVRVEFLRGFLGTEYFWVEKVSYNPQHEETEIILFLKGGFPNQYRHLLIQRAEFEGMLALQELHFNNDYEIDKELLDYYRR